MSSLIARHRLLNVERVGAVTVVSFARTEIMSLAAIDLIGRQLRGLVDSAAGRRVLLNFHGVERLSTPLIGKVVELHDRLKDSGGSLALCGISPDLYEIFDLMRLTRLATIYVGEHEALQEMQS